MVRPVGVLCWVRHSSRKVLCEVIRLSSDAFLLNFFLRSSITEGSMIAWLGVRVPLRSICNCAHSNGVVLT